jgi:hypothetical protein
MGLDRSIIHMSAVLSFLVQLGFLDCTGYIELPMIDLRKCECGHDLFFHRSVQHPVAWNDTFTATEGCMHSSDRPPYHIALKS